MPFEFVCPFCHHRTKVDDRYAGQSGPCAGCGKLVAMPRYNERGVLESAPLVPHGRTSSSRGPRSMFPMLIAAACSATAFIAIATVAWMAWPSIQKRAVIVAQNQDIDNMKLIAKALNAYADRHGTYPPPIVFDEKGKPLYSWRVLILPFLGYETLYESFQLDQPHDSANNLQCLMRMPVEFASPSSDALSGHQTNYALIVGPGTLFPPTGPLSPNNIDDPTLLLVETMHGMATWTEPGDVDVSQGARPGNRPMKDFGGLYKESFTCVTAQEEGLRIPNSVPGAVLDSLISPNGGEKVDVSTFQ